MLDAGVREISVDIAASAPPGLRYVCDSGPAIRRRRAGKGFVYLHAKGRRITAPDILRRIRSLVIPPAWTTDVWICPSADGHIQATGRDAKGRKQYRYHAEYREAREGAKFEHMPTTGFGSGRPSVSTLSFAARSTCSAAVAHLVSPNKLHHLYLAEWKSAYPEAKLWGPELTIRRRRDLSFAGP